MWLLSLLLSLLLLLMMDKVGVRAFQRDCTNFRSVLEAPLIEDGEQGMRTKTVIEMMMAR